jgi:diketogulonate reductase-like aldo/keto reductase
MAETGSFAGGSFTLRRGAAIPAVGLGTWQLEGAAARIALSEGLALGYRHIDTATVYRNEDEVGRALHESGVDRDELFITTKLPGNARDVRATIERSLSDLKVDFVDLWLIHWPPARSYDSATRSSLELYEQMLALRDEGLARSIGVSNYDIREIDELAIATGDTPEVNQIAWSPFLHRSALHDAHDAREVVLEGYSPLSTSRLDNPVLAGVASSHQVSAAQIVLRWHLQHAIPVIAKSAHLERQRANIDIFDFELGDGEMDQIDGLGRS